MSHIQREALAPVKQLISTVAKMLRMCAVHWWAFGHPLTLTHLTCLRNGRLIGQQHTQCVRHSLTPQARESKQVIGRQIMKQACGRWTQMRAWEEFDCMSLCEAGYKNAWVADNADSCKVVRGDLASQLRPMQTQSCASDPDSASLMQT